MQQKLSTREEYLKRINVVVEYINNHLNENIDMKKLSEISNFSPFHFQRIMRAFLGEPIGAFIVRKRVETAAQLIRHTELPIQEIAYSVGYDTPSSLSKVFRQFYGISPKEYRNDKEFIIMKPIQINEELKLKPKVVELEPKQAIYVKVSGDYQKIDYCGAWNKLWSYVKENKLYSAGIEHIAISYDDPKVTEADKLRSDICLVLPKKAEPKGEIGVKTMEGGKYLMFLYQGPYENLASVYDTIHAKYILEGEYTLRHSYCFDKYVNNPDNTPADKLKTEIYIPIE